MSTESRVRLGQRRNRSLRHPADGGRRKPEPEQAKEQAEPWNPCCLHKGLPGKRDLCERLARSVSRLQPFSTNVIFFFFPLHPCFFFHFFKADLLKRSQCMNRECCVTGQSRDRGFCRRTLSPGDENITMVFPRACTIIRPRGSAPLHKSATFRSLARAICSDVMTSLRPAPGELLTLIGLLHTGGSTSLDWPWEEKKRKRNTPRKKLPQFHHSFIYFLPTEDKKRRRNWRTLKGSPLDPLGEALL